MLGQKIKYFSGILLLSLLIMHLGFLVYFNNDYLHIEKSYDSAARQHRYSHLLHHAISISEFIRYLKFKSTYNFSEKHRSGDILPKSILEKSDLKSLESSNKYIFPFKYIYYKPYPHQKLVNITVFHVHDWYFILSILMLIIFLSLNGLSKALELTRLKGSWEAIEKIIHDFKYNSKDVSINTQIRTIKALNILYSEEQKTSEVSINRKIVDLYERLVKTYCKGYSVEFNCSEKIKNMEFPDLVFFGCFTNLLNNAVKHTVNQKISISINTNANVFIFLISNYTDKKISTKDQKRILGESKTNRLGILITKKFLNQFGGNLGLRAAKDKTTIICKLPISLAIDPNHRSVNNLHVAVIEDIEIEREAIAEELLKANMFPEKFEHTHAFFEAIKSGICFDIVLVDRHGTNVKERRNEWDAILDNFPKEALSYGFNGKIVLHTAGVTNVDKKLKFDAVLPKSHERNWKQEFSKIV